MRPSPSRAGATGGGPTAGHEPALRGDAWVKECALIGRRFHWRVGSFWRHARSPDERSTSECDIAVKFGADDDDEYRLVSGYEEFVSRYVECARSHGIAIRVRCLGASEASR